MSYVRIQRGECATSRDVLVRAVEAGAAHVLIEAGALPQTFYDLRSGEAGEVIQGLVNYGIRTAVVLPDMVHQSDAFRAFVKEANVGNAFRFFESEDSAHEWLDEQRVA